MSSSGRAPGRNEKAPGRPGLQTLSVWSVVAAEGGEQIKQTDEDVVDRHIEANRSENVVALATVNDGAGLIQDCGTGKQDEAGGEREAQRWNVKEQTGYHAQHQHHEADDNKAAEE